MCRVFFPVTLLVFSLVFQHGNGAISKCPASPVNKAIYFDLEQLGKMALQHGYNDVIHSPILCEGGNDSECVKQQCCHDEVGCCYTDPNTKVKNCGCKQLGSETCTYPAPLAILAQFECATDNITETRVCLRERRADEEKRISFPNTPLPTNLEANKIGIPNVIKSPVIFSYRTVRFILPFKEALGDNLSSANLLDQKNKCHIPPKSFLIYFDLEQLSLITLQQGINGEIQSPKTCVQGNDGDCSKQHCCHGEVGCCYTDHNMHIRKCGCKKVEDKTCSYPAPLAILANSQCENVQILNTSACLRERRWNEESFISTNKTSLQRATEPERYFVDFSDLYLAFLNEFGTV